MLHAKLQLMKSRLTSLDPVLLIFFAIAALIEIGALGLGWYQARVADWPRVAAQVLSSEVTDTGQGRYSGLVKVRLSDGQEAQLTTPRGSSDPASIQLDLEAFPAGMALGIPQNPDDPKDLRLPPDPSEAWLPWILAASGSLFALIPIGVVALSRRQDAIAIGGRVFIVCGAVMLAIGVYGAWTKIHILRSWPEVEATVVESRAGFRPGKSRVLRGVDLIVDYTAEGQAVRGMLAARGGSDPARVEEQVRELYAPGRRIKVRYQPGHPRNATFEAAWSMGFFWEALLLGGLGLVMAGLGAVMARFLRDGP